MQSVAMGARYEDWLARLTISAIASIHQEGVFKTLTIQQLLWGYEDEVLKMLQDLAGKEMVPTYTIGILHGVSFNSCRRKQGQHLAQKFVTLTCKNLASKK